MRVVELIYRDDMAGASLDGRAGEGEDLTTEFFLLVFSPWLLDFNCLDLKKVRQEGAVSTKLGAIAPYPLGSS